MTIRLPRLPGLQPIVDGDGVPTIVFSADWQNLVTQLEGTLNAILAIPEIQAALVGLDTAVTTAQTAADNANAAATVANDAAASAVAQTSLQGSYPDPSSVLTATDAGTSATIAIAAHNRVYSDGTTVAVNAGSIPSLTYSTLYYVYYDDPTFAGGTVSFQATTSVTAAAQTGARHTVGSVTTPAAAAPPSTGKGVRPPGVGAIP